MKFVCSRCWPPSIVPSPALPLLILPGGHQPQHPALFQNSVSGTSIPKKFRNYSNDDPNTWIPCHPSLLSCYGVSWGPGPAIPQGGASSSSLPPYWCPRTHWSHCHHHVPDPGSHDTPCHPTGSWPPGQAQAASCEVWAFVPTCSRGN